MHKARSYLPVLNNIPRFAAKLRSRKTRGNGRGISTLPPPSPHTHTHAHTHNFQTQEISKHFIVNTFPCVAFFTSNLVLRYLKILDIWNLFSGKSDAKNSGNLEQSEQIMDWNICFIKYHIYLKRIECCIHKMTSLPGKVKIILLKKRCELSNITALEKIHISHCENNWNYWNYFTVP